MINDADDDSVNLELPNSLFGGRTAIVTGSSRGVGWATALRLAEGGANVIVNYLSNEAGALETVEFCRGKAIDAIAVRADVSEFEGAHEIASQALEHFGRIDLLICNAGVWDGAPIEDLSEELWNKVINTNLKSAWAMTKACVPAMKKQVSGAIVMVSSTSGTTRRGKLLKLFRIEKRSDRLHKGPCDRACPKDTRKRRRSRLDRNGHDTPRV